MTFIYNHFTYISIMMKDLNKIILQLNNFGNEEHFKYSFSVKSKTFFKKNSHWKATKKKKREKISL